MADSNTNPLWQQIISKVGMPSTGSGGAGGSNKSTSQSSVPSYYMTRSGQDIMKGSGTPSTASKYQTPSTPETPLQKSLREAGTPTDQD